MYENIRLGVTSIQHKLNEAGWPENDAVIGELDSEERMRLSLWEVARWAHFDNIHYQYQQGFMDDEYYEHQFKGLMQHVIGPSWKAFGRPGTWRPSFRAEVDRILAESEENEQ